MKKLIFFIFILFSFLHSQAYRLYVHKWGSIDGNYLYVNQEDLNNDVHHLNCTDPGNNPCVLAGPTPICPGTWDCASPISNSQANELIEYVTLQVSNGVFSGSEEIEGIYVSWDAGDYFIEIEISD